MKGKRMLFGMMIVAALLIMAQASVSNADTYSGAWIPNDTEDIFTMKVTIGTKAGTFSMYDWGDQTDGLEIYSMGETMGIQSVYFKKDSGNWHASLTKGGITDLNLGADLLFGFSFGDGSDSYYSYVLTAIESGEVYQLSHGSSDILITTSDASPVPLPASALLLGSGMVGLIGFGKRMRKRLL